MSGRHCKCGEKGEPYAYLEITNIIGSIFGDAIDRKELADSLLDRLRWRYRCPRCYTELPNDRVGGPAGDMENKPGACPKCAKEPLTK